MKTVQPTHSGSKPNSKGGSARDDEREERELHRPKQGSSSEEVLTGSSGDSNTKNKIQSAKSVASSASAASSKASAFDDTAAAKNKKGNGKTSDKDYKQRGDSHSKESNAKTHLDVPSSNAVTSRK